MKEAIGVVLATIIVPLDLNNVLFKKYYLKGYVRLVPQGWPLFAWVPAC